MARKDLSSKAPHGLPTAIDLLQNHVLRTGGEHRPEQETMVHAVEESLSTNHNLLVQAGTGTGKSLAYLFPIAVSGKRAIIATATNQLSEQLLRHDLPEVALELSKHGKELEYALLKGRNNYICKAKVAELENLDTRSGPFTPQEDSLFDLNEGENTSALRRRQARADAVEAGTLLTWAKTSPTGDRSEAPVVTDRAWNQVSVSAADCVGAASCPFGDVCFTEAARARAKTVDIVVTNHALVAQEVKIAVVDARNNTPGGGELFGKRDILVVDEAHDFPDALTSALSTEVDARQIAKFLGKAGKYIDDRDITSDGEAASIATAREALEDLVFVLDELPSGSIDTLPAEATHLVDAVITRLLIINRYLAEASTQAVQQEKPKRAALIATLMNQGSDFVISLTEARSVGPGRVRWADKRRPEDPPVLRTAPLEVGDALTLALADRVFIATSATLTIGRDFTPLQRMFGLQNDRVNTLDVGSPFDYQNQGMLYIPKAPFPEPVGRDRTEHTKAVLEETLALITASGGRALVLTTTTAAAQRTAEFIRENIPHLTVLAHGEAPADLLVQKFTEEETSVLCATMGLWQGTNVPGPSCSLVVIDKVGFAPIDDVLTVARRALADSRKRDGFTEVVVAQAAVSLAQGAGRLIRSSSDRGVVAILDPRIHSKGYGKILLASLPPFKVFTERKVVTDALFRLTGGLAAHLPIESNSASKMPEKSQPKRPGLRKASSTRSLHKNLRPKKID